MTVFRSLFLAGIVLFFAAQQALCACAMPQVLAAAAMQMEQAAPAGMQHGHDCDEAQAPAGEPEHDTANCPHCSNDAQLMAQAANTAPLPIILPAPAPLFLQMVQAHPAAARHGPGLRLSPYQAAGPPKRTPLQLKTRFLN